MAGDAPLEERPGHIRALITRIQSGDEEARELLTRYESKVRLVVRRQLPRLLRSRFDSIDFLQSVWGSFFHRIRTGPNDLEEEENLIAFLAWAARNKVIDEYRRAASQKQDIHRESPCVRTGRPSRTSAAGETPSQMAQAHETTTGSTTAAGGPGVILELKAEGYSCREIGERLGLSERTVQRVLEDSENRPGSRDDAMSLTTSGPPWDDALRRARPPADTVRGRLAPFSPAAGRTRGSTCRPTPGAGDRSCWPCCGPISLCGGRREASPIEWYRDQFPELDDELLVALLYEEYCLREEAGRVSRGGRV